MNTIGKKLAVTGAILQLGPVFGIIGTVIGMLSAFHTIGQEGEAKPEALASDISFALITTAIGLSIGIIGLILMLTALFKFKYKATWLFWFLITISILMSIRFPGGTIIGICLLVYLITHRKEFQTPNDPASGACPDNTG